MRRKTRGRLSYTFTSQLLPTSPLLTDETRWYTPIEIGTKLPPADHDRVGHPLNPPPSRCPDYLTMPARPMHPAHPRQFVISSSCPKYRFGCDRKQQPTVATSAVLRAIATSVISGLSLATRITLMRQPLSTTPGDSGLACPQANPLPTRSAASPLSRVFLRTIPPETGSGLY
ncbi:hypothetical protein GGR58DRAFT_276819 [Xylaria digitata]|nr:hypothetical protein GGR58DRAFT_276819 [Xylaria digitata]